MVKAKKLLSVLLAAVLICFTLFSTIPARAAAVPVVKMVTQPSAEYNVGDRVKVQFNCPNYPTKRIQYRAFLWQVGHGYAQEIYKDYAKDGYFYKPVCVGKSVFTIDVFYPQRPGTYYIVVLAKPKGAKKYTSYIYTKTFTVKEKTPTVSVLDEEGKIYGSSYSEKPAIYDMDVKLTAKNITLKNASLSKDLYITGDNCTISNASVKGTIYIDPGKNGSANLNNVKADKIKVLSGGQDSIHLLNVTASVLSVDNSSTDSPVRIESDGTTTIDTTVVGSYSIIDNKSGNFGTIEVKKNEEGKLVVEFRGTFSQPVTVTDGAVIKAAEDATISKLIIAAENKDDKVTLEGSFNTVEISKKANIELSEGTKINTFNANANTDLIADENTKIETIDKENNEVNITGAGAGSVIYKPVTPPSGGGGYVTIPVGSITVTSTSGADAITTKNGTLQMIAAVMPAYATNKNVSWSVINGTGSASIDSSGLLKAITNGTVTVKAKAKDGSGVYGEKEIKISGQIYIITKAYVIGGTANVTLDNDKAATGETVTVEISEIETGKQFKSISVTDVSGDVAVKEVVSGSEYTFTMPDEPVTVSVTLDNIPVVVCPPLVNGLSFLDDNSNDTNTIIKLGVPSDAGDTFVYKISDDDSAVPTPKVGDDLSLWTPVTNGTSITAANGKHIGAAEVKNNIAVQFSDATAVTENENPSDLSVDNINIINQHTITFKSTDVDSIKVDDVDVSMSGTTAPYAEYANGNYTVNLAEPLTVGSHTITLTKSGYPLKTVTAGYFGKIERDPGNTGGNVTAVINGNAITFSGEVAFYGADESLGRAQGHYVGVKVTAPAGMTNVKGTATLTTDSTTYAVGTNWMDGDNYFYYYPLVTKVGQVFTLTVKWDGTDATADVFTIKIDDNAALEGEVGEPNNDIDNASAITVNADAKTQWIYPSTDEDWFKFEAQSGTLYKIQTSNLYPDFDDNMSYGVDTVIYIYDKDGNELDKNDDDASDPDYGCGSRIDFLCNESGTYYVKVVDYSNSDLDNETQENYVGRYDIAVTQLTGVTAAPIIQEAAVDNNNDVTVKGTSEAGALVFLTDNNSCYCNVFADASGNWEFTGLNLSAGDNISVTAVAENKSISTAATAPVNINPAQAAVNEVAAGITTIAPPEKDATTLTLPGVPEGYTIAIKDISNINWVNEDGTVIPQKFPITVQIVLTVTNTSTGKCANTGSISVTIPESSVGEQIDKITNIALGTITVGDAQTVLQKAQALVSGGYTVKVEAADGVCINASGVAIAAGNGSIIFTVAQDAGNIDPADTKPIAITVNASPNQDQNAPEGLTGVAPTTAANDDGKITRTTAAMEYKLSSDSTYAACGDGETAGLAAGTYDVRYAAKAGFNASAIMEVTLPNQDQAAPTGVASIIPTTFDGNDGRIAGTTTVMEYKLASADDSTYAACGEGETTGLIPETYNVRYAAKDGFNASAAIDVIISYNVASADDLDKVRNNLNGNYIQTEDIDLSGYLNWNPISKVGNCIDLFNGNYNGNGFKISNLTASGDGYYMGLFGWVKGQVENVNLVNVLIKGKFDDSYNTGGLVGHLDGNIKNSHITGCNITGCNNVGGLVGCLEGTILNSSVTACNVTGGNAVGGLIGLEAKGNITKCFTEADVSGSTFVGGLVGNNRGSIDECYATGSVLATGGYVGGLVGYNIRWIEGDTTIIKESYAAGTVSGNDAGGLVGIADEGTIETSYYDEVTTEQSDTGKGMPESTADMMKQATFINWDFNDIWTINEGKTYPTLQSNTAPNQDQAAPEGLTGVAPTTDANNDGEITGTTTAMEYKLASADDSAYAACGEGETTGLAAGTYDVRYAVKPGFNAGAAAEVTIPAYAASNQDQAAPTGLAVVAPTTDANNDGKITGTTTAMEYKLALADDSTYAACMDGETTDLAAGTYDVRLAAKDGFNAGTAAAVTVPAYTASNQDQDAPTGLSGIMPTTGANDDGKITRTTAAMEYKLSSDSTYAACGDGETAGLAAGTYDVRYAAKPGFNAGAAVNIIIPYNVASAGDLDNVRNDLDGNYIQTADIDLSTYLNWNPIGTNSNSPFSGSYNGNGYKISNLTASGSTYIGLFGYVRGQIKNVKLDNVTITATYDSVGSYDIGGLAGHLEGTIKNSYITGCNVKGYSNVGGLVGCNWQGSVEECSATGLVSTVADTMGKDSIGGLVGRNKGYIVESLAAVDVSGSGAGTGGLVGINGGGTIDKCYATGSVTTTQYWVGGLVGDNRKFNGADSIITESYAVGTVSGGSSGGLVGLNDGGRNDAGTIETSYYDEDTTTKSDTGKGIPESTLDMMKQATFSGWDFINTWTINEGATYPVFLMEN